MAFLPHFDDPRVTPNLTVTIFWPPENVDLLPHEQSSRMSHSRAHSDHPLAFEVVFTAYDLLILTGGCFNQRKMSPRLTGWKDYFRGTIF